MVIKRRGFTLSEVLMVIAIILVLASITYPVFLRSKASAKETVCIEKLRQIGLALSTYRSNSDGTDQPGDTVSMGFPNYMGPAEVASAIGGSREGYFGLFDCAGGLSFPSGASGPSGFFQLWPSSFRQPGGITPDEQQNWINDLIKGGGSTVVMSDPNHQNTWPATAYTTQFAIGLTLDGSIRKQIRRGDSSLRSWWLTED